MNADELRPGDAIDVLEAHLFGPDRWVPAEVVSVESHSVGALLMGGVNTGHFVALERATENRNWRRS